MCMSTNSAEEKSTLEAAQNTSGHESIDRKNVRAMLIREASCAAVPAMSPVPGAQTRVNVTVREFNFRRRDGTLWRLLLKA